jgi:hypothetical protein
VSSRPHDRCRDLLLRLRQDETPAIRVSNRPAASPDETGALTAPIRCPRRRKQLGQPFAAFLSWFLRIDCDRCGKVRVLNEAHASDAQWRHAAARSLGVRATKAAAAGAAKAELLTGVEVVSGRPVRRIELIAGHT